MNTKRKALIAVISVLFAVFLIGTLLLKINDDGYYGGTIVNITEYEIPVGYTAKTDLSKMSSASIYKFNVSDCNSIRTLPSGQTGYTVHKITVASSAGVKTVLVGADPVIDLDAMTRHPYLYTGGVLNGISPKSGHINIRVGDLIVFKFSENTVSYIYCNLSPRHCFSTNPIVNIVFASTLMAAIVFALTRKKAKDHVKLFVACSIASVIVSIGSALLAYFRFYLHPANPYLEFICSGHNPIRSCGMDWYGVAAFAVILTALLILFFLHVKNEGKQKGLTIIMLLILFAGLTGMTIHNRLQWERVDRYIECTDAMVPVI